MYQSYGANQIQQLVKKGPVDVYHSGVYDCGYLGCHARNILHATYQ